MDTVITRKRWLHGLALGLALGIGLVGAQSASALSFTVPAGRTVVDLDLSSAAGFSYDGTAEELTLSTDVDRLLLDDGSSVVLSTGQVEFSVTLMLSGSISTVAGGFGPIHTGSYVNGSAFDFTLIDTQNTASVLDDELVLGADFTGPVELEITESFFGTTGNFGGGATAGEFVVNSLNAALTGQVLLAGDTSAFLTNFSPGANLADGGGGLVSFTAQPNIDVNFVDVPEPAVAALVLAGGALGAALARRRRRRG